MSQHFEIVIFTAAMQDVSNHSVSIPVFFFVVCRLGPGPTRLQLEDQLPSLQAACDPRRPVLHQGPLADRAGPHKDPDRR